jgi:glycosyltransferase involved in cell wall biosynthesis
MKISVITTTYNRKDFLQQTIESVHRSALGPLDIDLEHIIYDDASTDGTETLFEHPLPHIKYIRGAENKGQSYGRNRAIEQAHGDYIFLIDSDDVILGRCLHNFALSAEMHPETAWFISGFLQSDEHLAYMIGKDYFPWNFEDVDSYLKAIFRGEHFIQSNVFFKKQTFHEVGGFDESMRMSEDIDLFIRFLLAGHMPRYCGFNSHIHRHHGKNLSEKVTVETHKEHIKSLLFKYETELKKRGII